MTDAMRSMLDELMGKQRNIADKEQQQRKLKFDEPEVCKHALAGLCPNLLFNNTKSDLGECEMEVHDDHIEFPRLKAEYDALSEAEKDRLGYERALYNFLVQLVGEMDRKIARSKERVIQDNKPRAIKAVDQARLEGLKQQEKEALERSEALAMEGDADGSIAMTEAAERFKEDHDRLHLDLVTPERTMSVCEVCGVFINSTDNEQRRLDHINGKQYVGWNRIRDKLKELEPKFGRRASRGDDFFRGSVAREPERRREYRRDERDARDRPPRGDYHGRDRDRGGYERSRGDRGYGDRGGGGYGDRGGRDYDRDHRRY